MQTRTPELAELIQDAVDFAMRDLHVALPARVESFDAAKQTANVQPLVKRRDFLDTTTPQAQSLPVINNVPVIFPAAGGYRMTFPVQKGDTVLLIFAHRSLDVWQGNGGEVDPGDLRHHDLSDAVAIVGLHDNGHPLNDCPGASMVIGKDGGHSIEIGGTDVATKALALAEKVHDEIDALRSWVASHQHGYILYPAAPTNTTPAATPALVPPQPPTVGDVSSATIAATD